IASGAAQDFENHPRADPEQHCRPPSRPRSPNPLLMRSSDSGTESTHTTPSVTPQHSPQLMRRVLDANITAKTLEVKKSVQVPLNKTRRPKLQVTNFDLNAVRPTSW